MVIWTLRLQDYRPYSEDRISSSFPISAAQNGEFTCDLLSTASLSPLCRLLPLKSYAFVCCKFATSPDKGVWLCGTDFEAGRSQSRSLWPRDQPRGQQACTSLMPSPVMGSVSSRSFPGCAPVTFLSFHDFVANMIDFRRNDVESTPF